MVIEEFIANYSEQEMAKIRAQDGAGSDGEAKHFRGGYSSNRKSPRQSPRSDTKK